MKRYPISLVLLLCLFLHGLVLLPQSVQADVTLPFSYNYDDLIVGDVDTGNFNDNTLHSHGIATGLSCLRWDSATVSVQSCAMRIADAPAGFTHASGKTLLYVYDEGYFHCFLISNFLGGPGCPQPQEQDKLDGHDSRLDFVFTNRPTDLYGQFDIYFEKINPADNTGWICDPASPWPSMKWHYENPGRIGGDGAGNAIVGVFQNCVNTNPYPSLAIQSNVQGTYTSGGSIPILLNTSYCIDYHIRNGQVALWVNGQPSTSTSPVIDATAHGIEIYKQAGWNLRRYEDNVKFSSTPMTLCGGAAPPPPPTSPFALIQTIGAVAGTVTTFQDTGLPASSSFCYRANNQDGSGNQGPYGSTVCGTTAAATVTTRRTLGTDTFNRANGGLGASYTQASGGNQIVSNAVEAVSLGAFGLDTRTDVLPNDQWISGTLGTFTGSSLSIGFLNLHSGDPNPVTCLYERNNSGGATSEIYVGATQKSFSATETWMPGDIALCEVQGTAVTFSHNGVVVLTANSTGSTSGKVSLTMFALGALTDNTLDAISWGDYVGAAQPTITDAVTDSTGSTLTPGGSLPSFVRVQTDTTNEVFALNTLVRTDATDSFSISDVNPLPTPWAGGYTGPGNLQVVGSAARSTVLTNQANVMAQTTALNVDQFVQTTLKTFPGTAPQAFAFATVRQSAPTVWNSYACTAAKGTTYSSSIDRVVNATVTHLATENAVTWANGDVLRCEVIGTTITLSRNGAQLLTITDATYANGRAGLGTYINGGALTDIELDNFSSGDLMRYTRAGGGWAAGLSFVCFFAQDVNHQESSLLADHQCDSLTGLTLPGDTTPPVLSGAAPSGTLAQGTTSTVISMISDEPAVLKFDTSNLAYASMANTMNTIDGLHHSATVTGLTDGASRTYYVRGQDLATPTPNTDLTSTLISFQVGIAVDTIPPILSGGAPSGVLPSGTTSVSMSVNSNENATCKYGTVPNTVYGSIASTFTTGNGTLVHSQTIGSLTDGNTYTYYIRCQDAVPNPNTSDYVITWSITALPPDVTPPVRSAGAPSGVKASGTTSVSMTLTTSENATCKYGIAPGVVYGSIANTFSTTGATSHSQTISGLVDGQVSTYFVRCRDAALNANPDDYIITWSVALSANDSTPPTAPTNLTCIDFSSSQASCTFTPGTDAVGVVGNQVKIGLTIAGVCTPSAIVNPGWGTTSPQQLVNLFGGVDYCVKINAFDQAGNLSADSNTSFFSTPTVGDPIPPSDVTGCVVGTVAYNSIMLSCPPATDNVAVQSYDWFRCIGDGCTNFNVKYTTLTPQLTDTVGIIQSTTYRYIVFANDSAGNPSLNPSSIINVQTPGLPDGITQGLCNCRNLHNAH